MDKEMIERLSSVIEVLGNIEVKGKANLLNLGGCIAILEEMRQTCVPSVSQKTSETKE